MLLTDWLYIGGFPGPLLRFSDLLEWLTELRKTVYLPDYQLI